MSFIYSEGKWVAHTATLIALIGAHNMLYTSYMCEYAWYDNLILYESKTWACELKTLAF